MNEREYIQMAAAAAGQGVDTGIRGIVRGIGDDCAVLDKGNDQVQLLSVDTLVEGVHFDRSFHPPVLLGRKILAVNLSDIAAMGGRPVCALLSSALPPDFDGAWMRSLHQGLEAACQEYGCPLVGGDTVATPAGFSFSLAIMGEMAAEAVLYRSGAKAGDALYVSGHPGFAAAGLALLQQGLADNPAFAPLVARHLNPAPRLELGQRLAASGLVHAMMDSSDGPATDLAHLVAASKLGALIFAHKLPREAILLEAAQCCHVDPQDWMLKGGEDFELLFAAPPELAPELESIAAACGLPLHTIGQMDNLPGLRLRLPGDREVPLSYQGYDHFPTPV